MDYQEVYDGLNDMFTDYFIDVGASKKDLEIRDKALEAVQIQIPIKPKAAGKFSISDKSIVFYKCSTCGYIFGDDRSRCTCCGQRFDWSNENDN